MHRGVLGRAAQRSCALRRRPFSSLGPSLEVFEDDLIWESSLETFRTIVLAPLPPA